MNKIWISEKNHNSYFSSPFETGNDFIEAHNCFSVYVIENKMMNVFGVIWGYRYSFKKSYL